MFILATDNAIICTVTANHLIVFWEPYSTWFMFSMLLYSDFRQKWFGSWGFSGLLKL